MDKTKLISCIVFSIILLASVVIGGNQEKIIVQCPFNAIKKVYPDYPEKLKKEGIPARFVIMINIDIKGNVIRAGIGNSLYPELEENIEKAIAQWKFEPYIHRGEPIRIFGFMKVIFYPGQSSLPSKDSEPAQRSHEEDNMAPVDEELQLRFPRPRRSDLKEFRFFRILDDQNTVDFLNCPFPFGHAFAAG